MTTLLKNIRVASFIYCTCSAFETQLDHLAATITDTELTNTQNNAVAISYVWGESDRESLILGHMHGEPGKAVTFTLGSEWLKDNFAKRLVELSTDYGSCWIDQLCIPQKEEAIRLTLAAIPAIFRLLPVVALLPGSLCPCLRKAYRNHEICWERQDKAPDILMDSSLMVTIRSLGEAMFGSTCRYSNGRCSWTERIWPSQELRYSTSVRLMWANPEDAACEEIIHRDDAPGPSIDWDTKTIGDPAGRKVSPKSMKSHDVSWDDQQTRRKNSDFGFAIGTFLAPYTSNLVSQRSAMICAARFLLGFQLVRDASRHGSEGEPQSDVDKILSFRTTCAILGRSKCAATVDRDLIISVFVDHGQYTIPPAFRSSSPWTLFEDGLKQIQLGFIPSRCPRGLLDAQAMTAHWDAALGPQRSRISASRDLYGLFDWTDFSQISASCQVPLTVTQSWPVAASSLMSFEEWSQKSSRAAIMSSFKDLVAFWGHAETIRWQEKWLAFTLELISKLTAQQDRAESMDDENVDISLEDTCFEIVCDVLHLDSVRCRASGVGLMFARRGVIMDFKQPGGPIGSSQLTIICVGVVNWKKLDLHQPLKKITATVELKTTMTVSLGTKLGHPFYEAKPVAAGLDTQYAVIGVWMPLDPQVEVDDPEAFIPQLPEDVNAWLV